MILIIDNYDSFVYNIAVYFDELGQKVELVRNDAVSASGVRARWEAGGLDGVVISPGPKSPDESGASGEVLDEMAGRVPVLGVCLGHQVIAARCGARVVRGARPMHGKVSCIENDGLGLFAGLPRRFKVTRYHSLVVSDAGLPDALRVDARAEDGAIMALSHRALPVYGVQFHPEAVLTEHGHGLLGNFAGICAQWKGERHGSRKLCA